MAAANVASMQDATFVPAVTDSTGYTEDTVADVGRVLAITDDSSEIPTSTPIRAHSTPVVGVTDTSNIEMMRENPSGLFRVGDQDVLTESAIHGVFEGSAFPDDTNADRRYESDMSRALEISKHDIGRVPGWGECIWFIVLC